MMSKWRIREWEGWLIIMERLDVYDSGIYDFGKSKGEKEKWKKEVRKILSSGNDKDKKKLQELEDIWKNK